MTLREPEAAHPPAGRRATWAIAFEGDHHAIATNRRVMRTSERVVKI
jgi:hypothetical protein